MNTKTKACGLAVFLAAFLAVVGPIALCPAENISYESALVWRTDNKGDFVLPVLTQTSVYTSSPLVTTQGLIDSISVSWKAEGPVALEVSADDGVHYAVVTNGVPLKKGFVRGTSLTWRAYVNADSGLKEVRLSTTDSSGVSGGFGNPELSGFKYRKAIIVSGSSAGDQFNYQVMVRVDESAIFKDDFSDIRFVSSDGETILPCFLEKIAGEKPDRAAEFFVKIPQIPKAGLEIYLYYGNPQAASVSDPEAVFDFYDDFSKKSLDEEKWSVRLNPGGDQEILKSGLLLDAASVTTRIFQFKGGIIEYSATAETGYESRLVIRDPDPDSESDVSVVAYSSGYPGAQHCIAVGNIVRANAAKRIAAVTRYDYRVFMDKDSVSGKENIIFDRYAPGFGEKEVSISAQVFEGPKSGFVGLKAAGKGLGRSITRFHWIRVRKHAVPEPEAVVNTAAQEERLSLPVMNGLALGENGNLLLKDNAQQGSYVSTLIVLPVEARVLVPAARGNGALLDISVDAGKTFRKGCLNNNFYYATKGDFNKGSALIFRVGLEKKKGQVETPHLEAISIQFAPGKITLISPNGGEKARIGSPAEIRWTAWDFETSYPMKLEYSLDRGKTFGLIVPKTANNGIYTWNILKKKELASEEALVRVSDAYDNSFGDISDSSFSIVE
jgi:hypothetical protein